MGLNILTDLLRGEDGRSSLHDTSAAGVCVCVCVCVCVFECVCVCVSCCSSFSAPASHSSVSFISLHLLLLDCQTVMDCNIYNCNFTQSNLKRPV